MKQELDNLDRLFVEHYKSMKAKKDVVVAPYEGSDTGVLRMEYDMVTEQIHILLKFDKANKMYNFRSERQYPSMDQEAAYHFAMDIAEKYDGFRCNAYDNTVIIQHVGTFRDMEETQAAALLKKSMESFERIAMEKLTEFGDLCNTISKEANVIGTLRASGYTKGELVRHYLSMPVIVTLISALVGNVLGYTVFKDVVVSMYYNSYSLPTYETIWNPDAFFKTTLIPVVLMFMVNLIVIIKMMQHTPLQFLRHDLKKTKRKKAMRLPHFKFFNRFRLRISECGKLSDSVCGNFLYHGDACNGSGNAGYAFLLQRKCKKYDVCKVSVCSEIF